MLLPELSLLGSSEVVFVSGVTGFIGGDSTCFHLELISLEDLFL